MGRIKEAYYRLKDIMVDLLEDGVSENLIDDYVKANLKNPDLYGFYLLNKEDLLDEIHADTGRDPEDLDESFDNTDPGIDRYLDPQYQDRHYEKDSRYTTNNDSVPGNNYNECLRVASELLEAGLDPYEIDDEMEHMLSNSAYEYWLENKTEILADLDADDQENYFEDAQFPKDYNDEDEEWIDPAGGTHYGYEEDPAKMYEATSPRYVGKISEAFAGKDRQQERFIDLKGPTGNAYVILGMAKNLTDQLKKADPKRFNWEQINAEMTAGDYNNLVHTFDRYFGDYVTIYGSDVLDEGCCGGTGKPKPKPRPRPSGKLLEDNSQDVRKIAKIIAQEKLDEKYIVPSINEMSKIKIN